MPPVSFAQFRREVSIKYGARAKSTRAKMGQIMREFSELTDAESGHLVVQSTADLTPLSIVRWANHRPDRTRTTARSLLRSGRAAIRFGLAMRYVDLDPFLYYSVSSYLDGLDDLETAIRHHSREDLAWLLRHLRGRAGASWKNHRLYALYATVLHLGLRRNEALFLRTDDVDFERGVIRIVNRGSRPYAPPPAAVVGRPPAKKPPKLKTKNSARPVPLSPELAAILRGWIPLCGSAFLFPTKSGLSPWTGGPPGYKPLDELAAAGRSLGIEGVTFLSMRHSLATHGAYWGIGPNDLRMIMRHVTLKTQESYLENDVANLRAAVKNVRYLPAEPDEKPTA